MADFQDELTAALERGTFDEFMNDMSTHPAFDFPQLNAENDPTISIEVADLLNDGSGALDPILTQRQVPSQSAQVSGPS